MVLMWFNLSCNDKDVVLYTCNRKMYAVNIVYNVFIQYNITNTLKAMFSALWLFLRMKFCGYCLSASSAAEGLLKF